MKRLFACLLLVITPLLTACPGQPDSESDNPGVEQEQQENGDGGDEQDDGDEQDGQDGGDDD